MVGLYFPLYFVSCSGNLNDPTLIRYIIPANQQWAIPKKTAQAELLRQGLSYVAGENPLTNSIKKLGLCIDLVASQMRILDAGFCPNFMYDFVL